ncbi:MAG: hypothetical protein Q7V57_06285 [Actinomycetota bacterium]|nr:hypothetical protein [Actinomycetota bacterium]
MDGKGWYAVAWIPDGVRLTESSDPYTRSDGGWTVFSSSTSGLFWFEVENLGATFHCTFEFASIECVMVTSPSTEGG